MEVEWSFRTPTLCTDLGIEGKSRGVGSSPGVMQKGSDIDVHIYTRGMEIIER